MLCIYCPVIYTRQEIPILGLGAWRTVSYFHISLVEYFRQC
uniref:Uncharacterized protein n=1 Tax=Anguilla anguilla TaxID=7936 RepID=A0A0E9VP86_ANGAN